MKLEWRSAGFALGVGVAAFAIGAVAVMALQGVHFSAPSQCVARTFSPLRAVPWVFIAPIPALVLFLVERLALKHPAAAVAVGEGPYRAGKVAASSKFFSPRIHLTIRVTFAALAVLLGVAQSQTWSCAFSLPATCHPTVKRIHLVPLGSVDPKVVDNLAKHFRDCYGLPIDVMPPLPLPSSTRNAQRDQSIADNIMDLLPACPVKDPACTDQLTVGITDQDIYLKQVTDFSWTFGARRSDDRVAVVSTFRMGTFNGDSDRPAKMLGKYIAIDYCNLPQTNQLHSMRYGAISGTQGLDDMSETNW